MASQQLSYPQWTEYRKKSGLDPLGMQNSSVNLYQRLLPGISNVTQRVRYYGFYAWLARTYAKEHGSTDTKDWQTFLRRAEAMYALTAQAAGGESGVAGILWAQKMLTGDGTDTIDFADHADPGGSAQPYLKQKWGVFGAAYGSQLYEIGVLSEADEHEVPVQSKQLGDPLADALEKDMGNVLGAFRSRVEAGSATAQELESFEPLVPSNIREDSDERKLYEDMLFARTLTRPDDIARRDTLLLILNAASHIGRVPAIDDVRWLFYAGMDETDAPFIVSGDALEQQRKRWWVYQANDLLHFAYETLLKFTLSKLESYPAGTTLPALISKCVSTLKEHATNWPSDWAAFCAQNPPAPNAGSDQDETSDYLLSETARPEGSDARDCTAENAWAALRLIAVVMQRAAQEQDLIKEQLGTLDREGFHSLVTELAFFAQIGQQPFSETIARLLEQRIIKRHLWVAHRKFRYQGDYTFLIEADNGLVRLRATAGPVFTNPRMGPAIRFLQDLHLIGDEGLTEAGRKLLAAS